MSTLAFAVQQSSDWRAGKMVSRITDDAAFAKDLLYELADRDEEDGTTRLTSAIDAAAKSAAEQGSVAVEEVSNPDWED